MLVFFVMLEHSRFHLDVQFILSILPKICLLDPFTREHRCKGRSRTVKFLRRRVIVAKYEYYWFFSYSSVKTKHELHPSSIVQ